MSDYKVIGIHNTTGREKLIDLASASPWKSDSFTIPASSSGNSIDIPLIDFHSVDYVITVWNDAEVKTKSMDMKVIRQGTLLTEMVRNKIGTGLSISVTPTVVGSIMRVVISTSESYDLNVNIAYLIL